MLKICLLMLLPLFIYANQWCEHHFKTAEQTYKIPKNLLHAIALTESGKKIPEKGMVAWPWSINVNGKGFIFPTKEKAVFAARFLQRAGIQSFDVGCMQINLMHHSDAFHSLEDAFDPEKNVQYAALFLKSLHQKHKDWHKASGDYHNLKSHLATPYKKKVSRILEKLHLFDDYSYMPHKAEPLHIALHDYFATEQDMVNALAENTNPINRIKAAPLEKINKMHPMQHKGHIRHYIPPRVNTMVVRQTRYSFGHKPITAHKHTHPIHVAKK